MNELTLLKTHGPAADDLRPEVHDRALAELLSEIEQASSSSVASLPRPRRTRLWLGAAAAAAATAVLVVPSMLGLHGSAAVALVAATPMTFPFTPTAMPADLGEAVFERDATFIAARYGSALDGVSITTEVEDEAHWEIPADASTTDVDGHTARVVTGVVHDGSPASARTVTVVWEDADHSWTAVRGSGSYASAARVEAIAESLRERPQVVDLTLEVAPKGWSVVSYKDDRTVTLAPNGHAGNTDMTVSVLDRLPADPATAAGAGSVDPVKVHGRTAHLVRVDDTLILFARTAQGSAFSLQAPAELFTQAQLIRVAEGVTYRR